MKTLKMVTHWTVAEADCIYQLLEDFRTALWESYGGHAQKNLTITNNKKYRITSSMMNCHFKSGSSI